MISLKCNFHLYGIEKSDESPLYQNVLALYAFIEQRKYLIEYFFKIFCLIFCFILKNFAVSWICAGCRGWIDICFQSWCSPVWLTGLKAPTSYLTKIIHSQLYTPQTVSVNTEAPVTLNNVCPKSRFPLHYSHLSPAAQKDTEQHWQIAPKLLRGLVH